MGSLCESAAVPDRRDHEGLGVRNAVRAHTQAYVNDTCIGMDVDNKLLEISLLIRIELGTSIRYSRFHEHARAFDNVLSVLCPLYPLYVNADPGQA